MIFNSRKISCLPEGYCRLLSVESGWYISSLKRSLTRTKKLSWAVLNLNYPYEMINYLKIINLAVVGSHSDRHTTRRRRRLIFNLFNLLSKIFALSPRSCMNHTTWCTRRASADDVIQCDELCESILMLLQAGKYLPSSTIRNREWRHSINKVCIYVMCLGVDEATKIVCAQSMDSRVDVSGGKSEWKRKKISSRFNMSHEWKVGRILISLRRFNYNV